MIGRLLRQARARRGLGAIALLMTCAIPALAAPARQPDGAAACPPVSSGVLQDQGKLPELAEGESLEQAWQCQDSGGEHLFTVSRVVVSSQRGMEVQFAQRTRTGKSWKKDWQARDFFPLDATLRHAPRNQVVLADVDRDGELEAYIAYILPSLRNNVDEGKLLVFHKGRKYAIRGVIPRGPDDFGSRQINAAFLSLPPTVQARALALWDQLAPLAAVQPVGTRAR